VDNRILLVLLTFVVAITPSLSDAEQLRHQWERDGGEGPHPWLWIGAWYLGLLLLLFALWGNL
jgi:hypothetical protein